MSSKHEIRTHFQKYSPIDGSFIKEYRITTEEEIAQSVASAKKAFNIWSNFTLKERFKYLNRVKNLCIKDAEYIAQQISLDTGKPHFESVALEILGIPGAIDYYAKIAHDTLSQHKRCTPIIFPGKSSYVDYFPMGVVAIISPWNFPFHLMMLPILTALIAGNTVVVKPSELTPITGDLVRDIFEQAGLPDGVVEVVQGDGSTGAALARAEVDKIFFTGSVATGKKVMAAAAEQLIPVELELGGKDPFIVCEDANLKRASRAAVWGSLVNCGQVCTSVERIFVVKQAYDKFLKLVEKRMRDLRVGEPDKECDIGPMISPNQISIVEDHLRDAVEKGATVLMGGKRLDRPGNWFEPTLVVDVTTEMKIYREETFGPVVSIMKVESEEEAITLANDHIFGLTGSVWTSDYNKGLRMAKALECGQASVNDVIQSVGNIVLPFGGVKKSGMGRYHGPEGLLSFVHTKGIQGDRGWIHKEISWFPYEGKYQQMLQAMRGLTTGKLPKALVPLAKLFKKTS